MRVIVLLSLFLFQVARAQWPPAKPIWLPTKVFGVSLSPLNIFSTQVGIGALEIPPDACKLLYNLIPKSNVKFLTTTLQDRVLFRITAGNAGANMEHGGAPHSIAVWEPRGKLLGEDKKHGHHIEQGNSRMINVELRHDEVFQKPSPMGGHQPAENPPNRNIYPAYAALVAQPNDPICISAIEIAWIDKYPQTDIILGDIGAYCGMPWYQSRTGIVNYTHPVKCMWMDGSSKTWPDLKPGDPDTDIWGNGTEGDHTNPPVAISFNIQDFTQLTPNPSTAKQRNKHPENMCGHPARFKVWWHDHEVTPRIKIPIYTQHPRKWAGEWTDREDFLSQNWTLSAPSHQDLYHHDKRGEATSADAKRRRTAHQQWRDSTLVMDEASARELCESETSWGADWFSYEEQLFCEMATKTLLPACTCDRDTECFDADIHKVRHKRCAGDRLCGRQTIDIKPKSYEAVEDSRAQRNAEARVASSLEVSDFHRARDV